MRVYSDDGIRNFEPWSGAVDTHRTIIEHGCETAFESLIEELYPDGLSDTDLNDILWFERDWIFESLDIKEDEEDEEDED